MTDAPERITLVREFMDGRLVQLRPGQTMSMGALGPARDYILATPRPMSEAKRDGTKVLAWWRSPEGTRRVLLETWWCESPARVSPGWETDWDCKQPDKGYVPVEFVPHPEAPK